MFVSAADVVPLKRWITPKLEAVSDADSEVLADYILALVRTEGTDDAIRATCLENLPDFLHDNTAGFVDEVLTAIREKSFLPGYVPPVASKLSATATVFNPPTGPAALKNLEGGKVDALPSLLSVDGQSRKRSYNNRESSEPRDGRDSHYSRGNGGNRNVKQMRQNGYNGRGGFGGQGSAMGGMPGLGGMSMPTMSNIPAMPSMPAPPLGFPPFDPSNPMAAFMAMQAIGFPAPGMPNLPMAGSPPAFGLAGSTRRDMSPTKKERCNDYDTIGRCLQGENCPYDHGADYTIVPPSADGTFDFTHYLGQLPQRRTTNPPVPEYDPNKASLAIEPHQGMNGRGSYEGRDRGRGRGRGRGDRGTFTGTRGRASFSHAGPLHDRSNTTIVVEQIPEDKFDDQRVRDFFSEFGKILDIQMQAYKRLAIVKFDDHFAAKSAYDSPKVVFDNRFVKVYWYKPDSVPTPPAARNGVNGAARSGPPVSKPDEEMIDPLELERKQAEAQKQYEEKTKKRQELEEKRKEAQDALKKAAEEKKKLLEKLAAKGHSTGASADTPMENGTTTTGIANKHDALQAKLAELQAEAEGLGLDPEADTKVTTDTWRGRGRGGYRARGFAGRGRGYPQSYRSRGNFTGAPYGARGGVKRLDNRPRRVAVAGVEAGTPKDEALRQYLLNNFEFESIEPHPDREDSQVIVFKERYIAEGFISSASNIPNVGAVELSWVANPPITMTATDHAPMKQDSSVADDDTNMEELGNGSVVYGGAPELDYDVADDEDRWIA